MARAKKPAEAAPLGLHVSDRDPTKPAQWEYADAMALRALRDGNANQSQQQRAIAWIVRGPADWHGLSFRAADPHATSFAEGKRYVAVQIMKLIDMSPAMLAAVREQEQRQAEAEKIAELKRQRTKTA